MKENKNSNEVSSNEIGEIIEMGNEGNIESTSKILNNSNIKSPSSYEIFLRTIQRANNLISQHKSGVCKENHYDSFRASVVLSISALDAFIRTLVVEKILIKLSEKEKPLSKELSDYIKGLLNQDALLESARKDQFRNKVERAIRTDFETKSFQGEYKINYYLELAGHKDIFEEISHSSNQNKNRIRTDLERFTKRRHIIAHCGDFDLNQIPHCENVIDKEYAQNCVKIVILITEHINKITTK